MCSFVKYVPRPGHCGKPFEIVVGKSLEIFCEGETYSLVVKIWAKELLRPESKLGFSQMLNV